MQMASENRTYELFWRQAGRWLAAGAPDFVSVPPVAGLAPGDSSHLSVDVRDEAFRAVRDAQVSIQVTFPGGETRNVAAALTDPGIGRYSAQLQFTETGVYKVGARAKRGTDTIGTAQRSILVGAADLEMSDPRLNEDVLRRVSQASGGRYLNASDELGHLLELVSSASPAGAPRVQELWQNIWMFTAIMAVLAAEWLVRRRWGLR